MGHSSTPSCFSLTGQLGFLAIVASFTASPSGLAAVLYSNDFESPVGFVDTSGVDVSSQTINSLYGQPGFLFQQVHTVETLHLTGGVAFGTGYSDPEGLGDNYAVGMLATAQDDLASLTFNATGYGFLNVGMDISAIDLNGLGGPFGVDQPIFRLSLYDSPGGVFNINAPGTLLDSADVTGTGVPHYQVLDWTSVTAALDTAGTVDGNVSLMIDLRQSGYAVLDNLRVVSSDIPNDLENVVPEPGTCLAGLAMVGVVAGAWRRRHSAPPSAAKAG